MVSLARSGGALKLPASVAVTGGNTSATFEIATQVVTSATTVTISATHEGVTKTGQLAIAAPAFPPKSVTATELTMTGRRFPPKSVTAAELTMTGQREPPR